MAIEIGSKVRINDRGAVYTTNYSQQARMGFENPHRDRRVYSNQLSQRNLDHTVFEVFSIEDDFVGIQEVDRSQPQLLIELYGIGLADEKEALIASVEALKVQAAKFGYVLVTEAALMEMESLIQMGEERNHEG